MIRAAMILLALTGSAEAASFLDIAHCWAYPHHERCKPPAPAPAEPVQAPAPAPLPAPVVVAPAPQATPQPPPRAAPAVVHRKPVKAKPRVKPKYKAAPVRRRLTAAKVAGWCAQVPKGTSMGQIEFFASLRSITLTASHRRQAQACLNSK